MQKNKTTAAAAGALAWVDESGTYHGQLLTGGGGLVNYDDVLVEQGWAKYTDVGQESEKDQKLQAAAEEQGLGAWGLCGDSWR